MSLRTFADILLGRRPVTISRRTPTGLTHLVVLDDTETVHHVHTHADLIVGRA